MFYFAGMFKTTVVKFYGSQQGAASFLGITRQAVNQWPELIPERAALSLAFKTGGRLPYDPKLYARRHKTAPLCKTEADDTPVKRG